MQELIAYHGTKNENINSILNSEFKPSISTSKKLHWLGKGIYFYEDLYYAVEWNYCNFNNMTLSYDDLCSEYGIIRVRIDIENFNILDLSSGQGYDIFNNIIDKLTCLCNKEDAEALRKDGDVKAIRIIEKIEDETGLKLISNFDVVCAVYNKNIFKKRLKAKGDFLVGVQKQICVKNQDAIISKEQFDCNQDKVKNLYNLIINNRRKIE